MAITQYNIILARDIGNTANDTTSGSLFARVNKVRQNHAASALQAGKIASNNPLNTHYNTNQAAVGSRINPTVISNLKTMLTHMKTYSPYVNADYGTGISVPVSGRDKITKSFMDIVETGISNLERVSCANTPYNSGNYSYDGSYNSGNYSYDGSFNSGNYSYDGSYRSGYNSSYNGSRFCGSFDSRESGYCRGNGYH